MEAAELASTVNVPQVASPISQLPQDLLLKMFSCLPLKDRYQLCLVSQKWAVASRMPWTDIIILKLNRFPPRMVEPILDLCPSIREIHAEDQTIILEAKEPLPVTQNLRTMKLRNVSFAVNNIQHGGNALVNLRMLFGEFFLRFPRLAEVSLREVTAVAMVENPHVILSSVMAPSLKQLVQVCSGGPLRGRTGPPMVLAPWGVQDLEYFFWQSGSAVFANPDPFCKLRELCLIDSDLPFIHERLNLTAEKLPKLEVLIYASRVFVTPENIALLVMSSMALRILVIAGHGTDVAIAAWRQKREQDLLGIPEISNRVVIPARPVRAHFPPLQVFIGGRVTRYVKFAYPEPQAASFWRIDRPMPEYLAQPEVAEVFADSWAARIIREGPANGVPPWGSPHEMKLFYSTEGLEFCS